MTIAITNGSRNIRRIVFDFGKCSPSSNRGAVIDFVNALAAIRASILCFPQRFGVFREKKARRYR